MEHFEHGIAAEELADERHDVEAVSAIIRRAEGYAFKRAFEPPYPQAKFY